MLFLRKSPISSAGLVALTLCAATSHAAADTNWSGLYGGLALGGAYSAAKPKTDVLYTGYFEDLGGGSDRAQLTPLLNDTLDGFDVSSSALLGYDYQDRNIVYGIEGDLTFMPFSETKSHGPFVYDTNAGGRFSTQTTVETDFSFSIRPKIGYATGDWQVYFAAGPSISRFKTTHKFNDNVSGGTDHTFTDTRTAFGVSSSIGAGYMLGDGWALRGDYVMTYFPQIVNGDADVGQGGSAADFSYDADFQSHNVRFALIKRF